MRANIEEEEEEDQPQKAERYLDEERGTDEDRRGQPQVGLALRGHDPRLEVGEQTPLQAHHEPELCRVEHARAVHDRQVCGSGGTQVSRHGIQPAVVLCHG